MSLNHLQIPISVASYFLISSSFVTSYKTAACFCQTPSPCHWNVLAFKFILWLSSCVCSPCLELYSLFLLRFIYTDCVSMTSVMAFLVTETEEKMLLVLSEPVSGKDSGFRNCPGSACVLLLVILCAQTCSKRTGTVDHDWAGRWLPRVPVPIKWGGQGLPGWKVNDLIFQLPTLSQAHHEVPTVAPPHCAQSCLTLWDPMDCSPPASCVCEILQARIWDWVVIPFSRGIFPTQGSNLGLLHCKQILYHISHQGNPHNSS